MLLYLFTIPFVYLLSLLPTGLLYRIAGGVAWLLEHTIKYRKEVVIENIATSFPTKSEAEVKEIAHQFYRHFADMLVENIKALTISPEELIQRIIVPNVKEIFKPYQDSNRSVVIVLGHCGAWQWAGLVAPALIDQRLYAFYSPLNNKYFDRLLKRSRSRYGMQLVSMRDYLRHIRASYYEGVSALHFFLFDQSPLNPRKAYWTRFLNQDTAFYYGPAHFAIEQRSVVLYVAVKYQSRGNYLASITTITENAAAHSPNEIIEKCVRLLEKQIEETPADWLWSHRRWKHKKG